MEGHRSSDSRSLALPSGSSATSPPLCVTLLHPTLRLLATNTGSTLSLLKVEAITDVDGAQLAIPIGVLTAGGAWQPTLPLPFLTNLVSPLAGTVQFRFTPTGLPNERLADRRRGTSIPSRIASCWRPAARLWKDCRIVQGEVMQ